jgi:POT family proton-dependent oligopeptide transporter
MKLNQFWIWLYFLVATAGELYVSPVGLSFVTTAAPKEIVGFACGCWFLSAFFGNYLAGEIGSLYASAKPFAFWSAVGVLSVSVGVALALARNKIVFALKEEEEEEEEEEETNSRNRGSKRRRKRRNTTRDERDASGGSNTAL